MRFRLQVLAVLFSLLLFLVLYVGLLALASWALYWSITVSLGKFVILKLPLIFLSGMLFLYLLKGLFKRDRAEKSLRIEITAEEHPRLFAFIRQLCEETQAPLPHRVFVSPEVNAAMFCHESFFSLFLPTPKNLQVGLAFANMLNLSEFKAVLAHEFGHFAQRHMKLNAYVYKANRIMSDIVFGKDWIDDFLIRMQNLDSWAALPFWALAGPLWLVRVVLGVLFRSINVLGSWLCRQMEFNADLAAVAVAGSDATVHALAKSVIASECWEQALSDLRAAANHHIYTKDIFFHQNHATPYLRQVKQDPNWGDVAVVDGESGDFFRSEKRKVSLMLATHPSNCDRERNAKRFYVECPIDERSPWALFDGASRLRERVTRRFYRVAGRIPKRADYRSPEEVQAFIDEEHAESTYGERYHGIYNNRFLLLGDISELIVQAELAEPTIDELACEHRQLFGNDLRLWTEEHQTRIKERQLLRGFQEEPTKYKNESLNFRGRRYDAKVASRLLKEIEVEDQQWLGDFDRRVFLVHYRLARVRREQDTLELVNRYRFHLVIQDFVGHLEVQQEAFNAILVMLARQRELTTEQYYNAREVFRQTHACMTHILSKSRLLEMPALSGFKKGEFLGPFLLDKPLINKLNGDLTGRWIDGLVAQVHEVLDKLHRLRAKSWGAILAFQEKMAGKLPG
jgi:Zn-dependent protease with chaperone function